ncbi:hypothetical protein DFJ73DRAFT_807205 [Zopfochytrium polystomum]|nr:hypothetical protein DFJ73DRAFT_807205 [Zopfochytrium polystomum]
MRQLAPHGPILSTVPSNTAETMRDSISAWESTSFPRGDGRAVRRRARLDCLKNNRVVARLSPPHYGVENDAEAAFLLDHRYYYSEEVDGDVCGGEIELISQAKYCSFILWRAVSNMGHPKNKVAQPFDAVISDERDLKGVAGCKDIQQPLCCRLRPNQSSSLVNTSSRAEGFRLEERVTIEESKLWARRNTSPPNKTSWPIRTPGTRA